MRRSIYYNKNDKITSPPMQFQRTLKNEKSREARKRVLLKFKKMCKIAFIFVRKNRMKNKKIAKK